MERQPRRSGSTISKPISAGSVLRFESLSVRAGRMDEVEWSMFNARLIAAAAALLATASAVQAEGWPTRPVTLVVTFAAGSGDDLIARSIAPRLSELLGQQVVIENVGGAGGMTGTSRVAKAAPDG